MFKLAQLKKSRVVHLCFAIAFFTSGLTINAIQCLLFYLLKPFNKRLYRQIGYYLCYSFYSQIVFISDWWSNCKLYVYCDEKVKETYLGKEHVLLLMNHTYEIDWLLGWVLCDKVGVLGNCKAYAKKVIQYIPTIGWSWKFAEFVFLERSYDKDKEIIGKQLNEIYDYPDPVWLLLNAEGTRFTEKKHEASIKFAKERGMTELKYHLIPRTKGFTASIPYLKKKCPAALDIQLFVENADKVEPSISNLLFGNGVTAHLFVERFDMSKIPDEEAAAAEWLQELFRRKDKLQDSFVKHGDFFTGTGMPKLKGELMKPRLASLINLIFWATFTLSIMFYYLAKLFFSGELLYFSIGIGILIAFYILMDKTINMSKISKASSYGSTDKKTH